MMMYRQGVCRSFSCLCPKPMRACRHQEQCGCTRAKRTSPRQEKNQRLVKQRPPNCGFTEPVAGDGGAMYPLANAGATYSVAGAGAAQGEDGEGATQSIRVGAAQVTSNKENNNRQNTGRFGPAFTNFGTPRYGPTTCTATVRRQEKALPRHPRKDTPLIADGWDGQ